MAPRITGISVYIYVDNYIYDDIYVDVDVYVYVDWGFRFTSTLLSYLYFKGFWAGFLKQEFIAACKDILIYRRLFQLEVEVDTEAERLPQHYFQFRILRLTEQIT